MIAHLAEHTAVIPILALWAQKEWGYLLSRATFETLVLDFEQRTTVQTIPETFVAIENDRPVGMSSIVQNDMLTRQELSPWLAGVYVAPAFRNRGIGSKLVQSTMQEAQNLGLEKLYLFTPDKRNFYARLGWNAIERTTYRGESVTIMVYEKTTPTSPLTNFHI